MSFKILVPIFLFFLIAPAALAYNPNDSDGDGISNYDETNVYFTNPQSADTDGDGLSDAMELKFHTDPNNPDTDKDGFYDGEEVNNAYNPLLAGYKKLEKKINVDTKTQELSYYLGDVQLGKFKVSTGKASMPTPKGVFMIGNKSTKAWSKAYGLWMPFWMGMKGQRFGIHELPEWPNGYKEGANHLGRPVSHGCIRLGVGPAKTLYQWADIGTKVYIN